MRFCLSGEFFMLKLNRHLSGISRGLSEILSSWVITGKGRAKFPSRARGLKLGLPVSYFQKLSGDLPVPGGGGGLQGLHGNAFCRADRKALFTAHAERGIHPVLFLELSGNGIIGADLGAFGAADALFLINKSYQFLRGPDVSGRHRNMHEFGQSPGAGVPAGGAEIYRSFAPGHGGGIFPAADVAALTALGAGEGLLNFIGQGIFVFIGKSFGGKA